TPFSGVGRIRYTDPLFGVDNYYMVNYQKHDSDGFVRDAEFYGKRGDPNYRFLGGANVPWSYTDADNMFLAALNANGEVLIQSYNRPWLGSPPGPVAPALQKYLQLSPHASYHPNFVVPNSDGGGHVKNWDFGPGVPNPAGGYFNNDSILIDAGFPVMTAPNGKRYKALFAG